MNYFEFYDIPVTIEVDPSTLKKIYFTNSRELHPDMHAGAEGAELEAYRDPPFRRHHRTPSALSGIPDGDDGDQ